MLQIVRIYIVVSKAHFVFHHYVQSGNKSFLSILWLHVFEVFKFTEPALNKIKSVVKINKS